MALGDVGCLSKLSSCLGKVPNGLEGWLMALGRCWMALEGVRWPPESVAWLWKVLDGLKNVLDGH